MFNEPKPYSTDTKMDCNVVDEEEARKTLCEFFMTKRLKPEIVLDHRMASLLDMLSENSDFSFDLFGRECLEIYNKERAKLKQVLKHVDGNISLTVDVLSSGKADKKNDSEFMCLAAHFIDNNWTLKRLVLNFSPLGGEGKDSPSEIILRSLKDWGIEDKIWTITVVNKSLYDEVFKAIKDKISRNPLNSRLYQVYCSADIVKNLVVEDAFESISEVLEKIEDMYSFGDASSTWENKCGHLKVAILTEESGGFAGIPYGKPSKKGWSKVYDICDLVENVYDLVFPLFEKGYQPANVFLCNLFEVQFYLKKKVADSNSFKKGVANKMLQTLDNYVYDTYFLLATASVMDPRLKMKHIEFSTSKLNESDWVSRMMLVLSGGVKALYKEYAARENVCGDGAAPELMQEYIRFVRSAAVKSEVEMYLEEPVLAWNSDFNALTWWKDVGSTKYPLLSKMARDFLGVPFTIAVGDEALMIEQRKVESCLAYIQPSMANACTCIRSWLLDQNSALSS